MTEGERGYWFAFNFIDGIGPARFALLRSHFGSAEEAWDASEHALQAIGVPAPAIKNILTTRRSFDPKENLDKIRKQNIDPITLLDAAYPNLLKTIPDPPFVLYARGDSTLLQTSCIAVVGTRKMTSYGQTVTETITNGLVDAGLTIVSGLALGVDGEAHRTTLEHGGKTIAVLGCGVDCIYPPRHKGLADAILREGGAIIAEAPLSRWVSRGIFPARNRIVSGLSLGVVICEAAERSGALITARLALEQGREVFAIPGPITSQFSKGPSQLIQQGAKLAASVEDILSELPNFSASGIKKAETRQPQSKEEQAIVGALQANVQSLDDLIGTTQLPASTLMAAMSMLELKGWIRLQTDGKYALV
ncbi:MAG: DNA-processing protein DprA [bacterium]|nr:DNA-processing protein DprA [bacterium]